MQLGKHTRIYTLINIQLVQHGTSLVRRPRGFKVLQLNAVQNKIETQRNSRSSNRTGLGKVIF